MTDGGTTIQTSHIRRLPGYQAELADDAVLHSQQKLAHAAKDLQPFVDKDGKCSIVSMPCMSKGDTLGYRCKCSFQLIEDGSRFQYAMRVRGEPVPLGDSVVDLQWALTSPVRVPLVERRLWWVGPQGGIPQSRPR